MGNAASGSSGLTVSVDPPQGEKISYLAGSKLTGTVYATTTGDEKKSDSDRLQVFLIGKEDVCVRYTTTHSNGNNGTTTQTHYAYAKRDIVRVSIPLIGVGTSVNPGNHAYPFEVQLPDHIPTSMMHTGDGGHCNIVYKIKVEVSGKWRNHNIETPIVVLARPPDSSPVPNFVEPTTQAITMCCCIPRGNITFGASIDDTRVGRGEVMSVNFGCKNEASTEIEYVEAYINEKIGWSAHGHSSKTKHKIVERRFNETDDMQKRSKEQMRQLKEDLDSEIRSRGLKDELYREILAAVQEGNNKATIEIPFTANHTYMGSCMSVSHTLTIKVKTASMSSNPERKMPIQIVTEVSAANGMTGDYAAPSAPLPEGWNSSNTTVSPLQGGMTANTVFGGGVTSGDNDIDVTYDPMMENLGGPVTPSLQALLKEVEMSISAKSTIEGRIADPSWKNAVFAQLQPNDLVMIVKKVTMEFDQTDVAVLIAPAVSNFTCAYIVALVRSVSDWMRTQFVQKLLQFCTDLQTNSGLILAELSDWERISTERDFEQALKSRV
jgi:hypothetical protein